MNSAFNRRTVLRGAVLLAGVAAGTHTVAAADFKELTWKVLQPGNSFELVPTRVISGIPATIGYGKPVAIGPVVVQATCDKRLGLVTRAAGYNVISAMYNVAVVVTDARGLSGRFPVAVSFPRTEVPSTQVEFVLTGTATLAGPGSPPAARNPGTMQIAVEPRVTGVVTFYNSVTGAPTPQNSRVDLIPPNQDRIVATIEVR